MPKLLRFVIATIVSITSYQTAITQSLSVNSTGSPAAASSILDVESTTKGVLIPRMNKTQKNAIASPANGLLVFQSGPDSVGFHYYDLPNTRWVYINTNGYATDSTAWKLTGNNNVVDTSFLGRLNNKSLKFRYKQNASGPMNKSKT